MANFSAFYGKGKTEVLYMQSRKIAHFVKKIPRVVISYSRINEDSVTKIPAHLLTKSLNSVTKIPEPTLYFGKERTGEQTDVISV